MSTSNINKSLISKINQSFTNIFHDFLVGGSVPVFDEIIISMSLMNQVLSFDDVSGEWTLLLMLFDANGKGNNLNLTYNQYNVFRIVAT